MRNQLAIRDDELAACQPSTSTNNEDKNKENTTPNATQTCQFRHRYLSIIILIILHIHTTGANFLSDNVNRHKLLRPNRNRQHDEIYTTTSTCTDPVNLSDQFLNWFHDSQSDLALLAHMTNDNSQDTLNNNSDDTAQMCTLDPTSDTDDQMDRALCPWEWIVNRDDTRQPKLISEARCVCHRARGNVGALCAPIQREMPVLRRLSCDPSTGKYEYIRGYHTITVGCHSVVPRQRRAHTLQEHLRWRNERVV